MAKSKPDLSRPRGAWLHPMGPASRWIGPLVTVLVAGLIELIALWGWRVPSVGAAMLLTVALSALLGGLWPGSVSALLSVGYHLYYFDQRGPAGLTPMGMERVAGFSVIVLLLLAGMTVLRRRMLAHERERMMRIEAQAVGQHYEDLVQRLDVIIWKADANTWEFEFVSKQAERVLGYPVSRWVEGEPDFFMSIVHEEDRERVMQMCRAATERGEDHDLEYRMVAADGRVVWVRDLVRVACDPAGRPMTSYGVILDVTREHEAQEALRESEARLRAIVDNAVDAIITIDEQGMVHSFNASAERIFGYERDEVMGKNISMLMPEPDRHQHDSYLERYGRTGERRVIGIGREVMGQRKDGSTFPVDLAVSEAWLGGRRMYLGLVRDISERKQAEAQLDREHALAEQERARLQAVLEILPVGVYLAKKDGELVSNAAGKAIWGEHQPPREVAKYDTYKAWRPGEKQPLKSEEWALARALRNGETTIGEELEIEAFDGARKAILNYALPIRDAEGRITEGVAVNVDITARKRTEEELKRLNETLEQRVAERTMVAEQRAAQLRALASELTMAEQRERRRLAQTLHDHLQQILAATKFRTAMLRGRVPGPEMDEAVLEINDMVDQAIGASRSLTVELSPPVLYDAGLVPALDWLARQNEQKHGLTVTVEADSGAEPAAEDMRVLLFQAVRELLFNVVKHAGVKEARVQLTRASHRQVRVVVEDEGRGFDPENVETGASSPTGFGLFSLAERLEVAGGTMEVESEPGQGARVTLLAPMDLPPPEAAAEMHREVAWAAGLGHEAAGKERGAKPGAIRVLLADDHKILREGLAGLLAEELDIEVIAEAADGQEAVELARRLRPDVVVMDITMPRLSGIEATRRIREELDGVSVIGLSIHEERDMSAAMHEAGACAYLNKAGPSEVLISAIRECVGADGQAG